MIEKNMLFGSRRLMQAMLILLPRSVIFGKGSKLITIFPALHNLAKSIIKGRFSFFYLEGKDYFVIFANGTGYR